MDLAWQLHLCANGYGDLNRCIYVHALRCDQMIDYVMTVFSTWKNVTELLQSPFCSVMPSLLETSFVCRKYHAPSALSIKLKHGISLQTLNLKLLLLHLPHRLVWDNKTLSSSCSSLSRSSDSRQQPNTNDVPRWRLWPAMFDSTTYLRSMLKVFKQFTTRYLG